MTTILVVEDCSIDFEAISRGFRRAGFEDELVNAVNGEDALDYLHRRESKANKLNNAKSGSLRPEFILLDINLPGTNGMEVLREIRANEKTKGIPVVALTTSVDPRDVDKCYQLGVNSYLQKPASLAEFYEVILQVKEYWIDTAILPKAALGPDLPRV